MAQECLVRQNYHEETEAGVNKQINLELTAFYTYLSMVCCYKTVISVKGYQTVSCM